MKYEEKKIIGLATLGGMLELYDFAIYGTFSIYFAHQFFPTSNPYTVIIETYMVFLLGFILRPVGGLLFSHIGDEFGRKKVLVYTIFIMGISSLGISCLPTYSSIGMGAPILLLCCRLLQGLALGGELPTTYVYLSESLGNKKILGFGFAMSGIFCGYLLAAAINYFLQKIFDEQQLNAFAWRIPFFIGGIICFISYKVRKSLHETPEFQSIMNKPKFPLVELLKNYWPKVIVGVAFSAAQQVFSVVTIIFMPTYMRSMLHLPNNQISIVLPLALIATVATIMIAGLWLNRFNNLSKIMLLTLLGNIVTIPISYYIFATQISLLGGYVLIMIAHGFIGLLVPIYLTALFPSKIRLSGVALSYNLSITTFAGFAPIIITGIIKKYNWVIAGPVSYILIFILLSMLCMAFRKNNG